MAYNISPTICRAANGDLLLAYREGDAHHSPGLIHIRRSSDDGRYWQPTHLDITPESGWADARGPKLLTHSTGAIILAYTLQNPGDLGLADSVVRVSNDHGATFGPPVVLGAPFTDKLVVHHPVERADGSLLLPIWGTVSGAADSVRVLESDDVGATWSDLAFVATGQEGEIVPGIAAGSWLCFYRGGLTRSTDDGVTWASSTTDLDVKNWLLPVRSSETGALIACIRNDTGGPVALTRSTDDGVTWATPEVCDIPGVETQLGGVLLEIAPRRFHMVYVVAVGAGGAAKASDVVELG